MSAISRKRNYAERLYIEDGWTNKAIAETVGTSENTVGNWVRKFKWKEKRDELLSAPHKIKQKILEEVNKVLKGEASTFNADTLSKLTRALERIDQKVSTQIVISVFKEYDNWLAGQDVDSDFLNQHLDQHKTYLQYRIEHEQ